MSKLREIPLRSIIKGITWRIIATLATVLLVFLFTDKIVMAFEIGGCEIVAKLLLYYLHERVWNRINWGKYIAYPNQGP